MEFNPFVNQTSLINQLVLSLLLPANLWEPLPHFFQTWLRNYLAATIFYLILGFLWCFYIYYFKLNVYIPKDSIPERKAMLRQIYVAMKALPCFTIFPTVSEHIVERGWTKSYSSLDQINWFLYLLYTALYLVLVEFMIYWAHKALHESKFLYKHIHKTHHIYNKQNTISPFAGLAFNPLDGIIQSSPQIIALFIVPMHFTTHIALLVSEFVWAANIHDCIHANIWPIMGGGYHTLHHTTYKHNYGHKTIWMDWMFGTLKVPSKQEECSKEKAK